MQRRVSDPWMESLRAGLSCRRSPFLNQWMVLTTMLPAFSMQAVQSLKKQKYGKAAVWLKKKEKEKKNPKALVWGYPWSAIISTEEIVRSRLRCVCGWWQKPADARNNSPVTFAFV